MPSRRSVSYTHLASTLRPFFIRSLSIKSMVGLLMVVWSGLMTVPVRFAGEMSSDEERPIWFSTCSFSSGDRSS